MFTVTSQSLIAVGLDNKCAVMHDSVMCMFLTLLHSGESRQWVQFREEENITYDVQDLKDEPEILSTNSIEV